MTKRQRRPDYEERILAYVAVKVAGLLRAAGVSQRELARRMDVSDARVSQILSGKANPTVRSLARLADVLGFTMRIAFVANGNALARRTPPVWADATDSETESDAAASLAAAA